MLLRQIQIRSLTPSTSKKRNAHDRAAPVLATFSRGIFVCRSGLTTQLGGNHESLALCGGTARRGAGGDISARDCHSTRAHVRTIVAAARPWRSGQATKRWCWPPARQTGCNSWTEENVGPIVTALSSPGFCSRGRSDDNDGCATAGRPVISLLTSPLKREDVDGD